MSISIKQHEYPDLTRCEVSSVNLKLNKKSQQELVRVQVDKFISIS